jgi:O-antigen/teichoic acid export membrane protein
VSVVTETPSGVDLTPPRALVPAAPSAAAPRPATGSEFDHDVLHAVRNAAKLGLSLVATWGIALVVKILLPRQVGPGQFGAFNFADAVTSGTFVFASLGIDTWVRKEVATRREQAVGFHGGLLLLRVALTLLLAAITITTLALLGKPTDVLKLVAILSAAQFFMAQNGTYGALLHAVGEVNGLSVLNIATKLVWGAGMVIGLLSGGGIQVVALTMLGSEALKLVALDVLTRRHLPLRLHLDVPATLAAVVGSLPFFITSLSQSLYAKIDVTLLSFLSTDVEVGWYGAASSVAGMAMLLAPILSWVLLPLTARAEARSSEELTTLTRRAMEVVLAVAVPVTLALALGADLIVPLLFGKAFLPATMSLRVIAPVFLFTYVGIVTGQTLVGLGRGWVVTGVMMSGLVLSPLLNWLLIPRCHALLGAGGAGVGAAAALNLTEAYITVVMTLLLGSRAFDRRRFVMLVKTAVVCAAVVALDRIALSHLGWARLMIDGAAYVTLVVAWGAVDHRTILEFARRALTRKKTPHAVID